MALLLSCSSCSSCAVCWMVLRTRRQRGTQQFVELSLGRRLVIAARVEIAHDGPQVLGKHLRIQDAREPAQADEPIDRRRKIDPAERHAGRQIDAPRPDRGQVLPQGEDEDARGRPGSVDPLDARRNGNPCGRPNRRSRDAPARGLALAALRSSHRPTGSPVGSSWQPGARVNRARSC